MKATKYNVRWTWDELVLALYLYCQIPFAKTKANNPDVIRLAEILGRTPSAVARKLGNFGAFDPLLAEQGISGLSHYSKADRETWDEFHRDWNRLVLESQRLLSQKQDHGSVSVSDETSVFSRPPEETERETTVTVRLGQSFFRKSVLASYEYSCCVCGLDISELLIGSHIVPWSIDRKQRADPQNGLCLCALHDKAFDRGFISVRPNLEILVSSRVLNSSSEFSRTVLGGFQGQSIRLPNRFSPETGNLTWHVENVFLG